MRAARLLAATALACLTVVGAAPIGSAQTDCPRAVVFALPGITWADVERAKPPNLLRVVDRGSTASLAMRTVSSRTSYASGFATIGAGTRLDGGSTSGGGIPGGLRGDFEVFVRVSGLEEIEELAEDAGYDARPGALAGALGPRPVVPVGNSDLGLRPPTPFGQGRWALLAAVGPNGKVPLAATGSNLLEADPSAPFGVATDSDVIEEVTGQALDLPCATVIVDHGDPTRADALAEIENRPLPGTRDEALLAADELLGSVAAELDLDRDLLIVVSPTSPAWDREVHLGVAAVAGPGFPAGTVMRSATTRRAGIVTLPDIAPTVLKHFDVARADAMLGRPMLALPTGAEDRIGAAVAVDSEAVYMHGIQADVATGFVLFQVAIYVLTMLLLRGRERNDRASISPPIRRGLEYGALAVVAFPLANYLSTPIPAHSIRLWGLLPAMIAIDLAVVWIASALVRQPLGRLLLIVGVTFGVMVVDLFLGGRLQFSAIWGNDPINAGRFAGIGNLAFAILGTCSILTASLLLHRWPDRRPVVFAVIFLFLVTVIADGAPPLGSDVGGVLALVPALAITFFLLTGRRPTAAVVLVSVGAALLAIALFVAFDLARPAEEQTHLGRFFGDVQARGFSVVVDTIERKVRTNLRVFGSTIWTYLVPPALALIGWLLLRPRGRWRMLADTYPRLRAGLIGGIILAVLGFAVNDSGIVVPAMVLSFLVPMALLIHLAIERTRTVRAPVA